MIRKQRNIHVILKRTPINSGVLFIFNVYIQKINTLFFYDKLVPLVHYNKDMITSYMVKKIPSVDSLQW